MNPTAGSFLVNPRLQRWFATFAIGLPGPTSLLTIYQVRSLIFTAELGIRNPYKRGYLIVMFEFVGTCWHSNCNWQISIK